MLAHGIAPHRSARRQSLSRSRRRVAARRRLRRLRREHRHRRPGDDPRRRQESRLRRRRRRSRRLCGAARASSKRTTARPRSPCAAGSRKRPSPAPPPMTPRSPTGSPSEIGDAGPAWRAIGGRLAAASMRYGENPHQRAALLRARPKPAPASPRRASSRARQLSYNNVNDTDAAFELVAEFDPAPARPSRSSSTPIPAASAAGADAEEAY